jgi:hypothetical protein
MPVSCYRYFYSGASIGKDNKYHGVSAGDIIGFPGHVGVYVGEAGTTFIDVNGAGGKVRTVGSGYGGQEVFKYSY